MDDFKRLIAIIDRLRGPEGCPWDRSQNLSTLRPYLIDEAYELLAAINNLDGENLTEELGDLLFHLLMICRAAEAEENISLQKIIAGIEEKMIRRHPHVFSDTSVSGPDEVCRNWERIKETEKKKKPSQSALGEKLPYLPALRRAQRVQKKAARAGFDWESAAGAIEKMKEELGELEEALAAGSPEKIEREMGDILFTAVNLARHSGSDAELTLQKITGRWSNRFREMEDILREQELTPETAPFELRESIWKATGEGG